MPVSRRGFLRLVGTDEPSRCSRAPSCPRAGSRRTSPRPRRRAGAARPRPVLPPGVDEIRISSNENPLGPGKAALDAILGKFPEAGRYPFNSTPADARPGRGDRAKYKVKPENIVLGAGSQEILKSAMRAWVSPTRRAGHRAADVRELHRLREALQAADHRSEGGLGDAPRRRRR